MFRIRACTLTNRSMEPDVAEAVTFVNLCRTFRALPRSGGVLDQDSWEMFLIQSVTQWQNERQALDQKRGSSGP